MNPNKGKTIALRVFSVLLMAFAIAFGVTYNGYCLGDHILAQLGLKAWSDTTQGLHYTAVYALILLWAALYLLSTTAKRKKRAFQNGVVQGVIALVCAAVLFLAS